MYIYLITVDLFLYLYIWTGFYEDIQAKICEYKGRYKAGHVTSLVFEVNLAPIAAPFVESINYDTVKLH